MGAWLLLVLAVGGAMAVPAGRVSPASRSSAAAAASASPALSAAERACMDDLKLLYPGDGKCYQLLLQGPCRAHEWLVLDARTDRLRPTCAREPCAEREVLWPRDSRCYQRFRDRETLCPHPGNLLVSNPFGLGECACMRTPPHARDPAGSGAASGPCYPLYHRGPCREGHTLVPRANGTADQGVCAPDPCRQPSRAQQQDDGQDAMPLVLWREAEGGDGRCHPLGSKTACPEEFSFGVHPQTLRPGCLSRLNHLLPPTPCSGDRCSPTSTASYSDGYIKELIQAQKMNKVHRRGG